MPTSTVLASQAAIQPFQSRHVQDPRDQQQQGLQYPGSAKDVTSAGGQPNRALLQGLQSSAASGSPRLSYEERSSPGNMQSSKHSTAKGIGGQLTAMDTGGCSIDLSLCEGKQLVCSLQCASYLVAAPRQIHHFATESDMG